MKQFTQRLTAGWQRIVLAVSLLAFAAGGVIAAPPQPASAAGCHWFTYYGTLWEPSGNGYVYTLNQTVPSSSTCNDINIRNMNDYYDTRVCANVRVRFFPSGGGNYANGWTWHCGSYTPRVIASNVSNGTVYRIEFDLDFAVTGIAFD